MPNQPAKPLDAATVVLVRDGQPEQLELFLMRRHSDLPFMGGACVFPGGRLESADCDPALVDVAVADRVPAVTRRLAHGAVSEDKVRGLLFCALRELFEEAGVLLAYDAQAEVPTPIDITSRKHLRGYRAAVQHGELSLLQLAKEEKLEYALDRLIPLAHWITPESSKRRYDTRFFLAELPAGQRAVHDDGELVDSSWNTPAAALQRHSAGEMLLAPPTLKTVEDLKLFARTHELFAWARERPIYAVLPQPFKNADGSGFKLPTDPEYTIEGYKQPAKPGEVTRIALIDDKWKTLRYG